MNIIYDTQSTINENINLRLNGLRLRSETGEGLKNLNGKWIQICMRGFRPFSGSPGLRAGVGAADFLHVRHPIPQSRFASVGGCKPRSRPCGLLANQGRAAVFRSAGSAGSAGSGGSPAAVRVVGKSGWGGGVPVCRTCRGRRLARGRAGCWRIRKGGVPVCRKPGARVCLSGSRGGQSDADTGVGRPESGGADECRDAFGLPACLPACREMRGPVTRTASSACRKGTLVVGTGALPCLLPAKNEGSPERLPSPSKINP